MSPIRLPQCVLEQRWLHVLFTILVCFESPTLAASDADLPDLDAILEQFSDHCFQCHGYGESEGGFSFEDLSDGVYGDKTLHRWEAVWKNVQSETMPPATHYDRPSLSQRKQWLEWINREAFGLRPDRIDPGQVTLRRLNRSEYQSTIATLTGVDMDVRKWLPSDDTGYGFDTVGEALTLSPMVLERYLSLSQKIVNEIFPPADPSNSAEPKVSKLAAAILFNGPPNQEFDDQQHYQHVEAVIERFANRAFRRPIDPRTLRRLTEHAIVVANQSPKRYQDGIASAIRLILVSPRFLYRAEQIDRNAPVQPIDDDFVAAKLDDYSLATRLSYFLWGTMPDARLLDLAAQQKLTENLETEIDRMIESDPYFSQGIENFVGQWLNVRDVELLQVDGKAVLRNNERSAVSKVFNKDIRKSMQRETYTFVEQWIRQDRPLHELLNADYTYLNRMLAEYYGIETTDDLSNEHFERVELPPDSHRRGILTHASVLLVTSNPSRTSPVKRGLFVLENLLGVPSPPAPPDVPELAESATGEFKSASLRQILAKHREDTVCASCHQRMDPIGLALENYNAIGQYVDATYPPRDDWKKHPSDQPVPVDSSGTLMTGESFEDVMQMVDILANDRRRDFHRCVAEKWLVFAIGRGLTYRDSPTVDSIVAALNRRGGSARDLIHAIAGSLAFTHVRVAAEAIESNNSSLSREP